MADKNFESQANLQRMEQELLADQELSLAAKALELTLHSRESASQPKWIVTNRFDGDKIAFTEADGQIALSDACLRFCYRMASSWRSARDRSKAKSIITHLETDQL